MQRPHRRHTALDAFLRPSYLSKNLDAPARLAAYFHHFQYLTTRFSPEALESLRSGSIEIYSLEAADKTYICHLALCDEYSHEGEMRVSLYEGDTQIYTTRFSFVPGSSIGVDDPSILLISVMQGEAIGPARFREISKAFHEISPQALGFCAMGAIAESLGIRHIACVTAASQPASNEARLEKFRRAYDDFMISLDAHGPENDLYIVPHSKFRPSDREADDQDMPLTKRKRKQAKRKQKSDIMDAIVAAMARHLVPGQPGQAAALTEFGHAAVSRRPQLLCVPISELGSKIGIKDGSKIRSTGKGGYLIHGPAIKLAAGTYRTTLPLRVAQAAQTVTLEVCVAGGNLVLMKKVYPNLAVGTHALTLLWSIDREHWDVEFRLRIDEGAELEVNALTIEILGENHVLPGLSKPGVPLWCTENEPPQVFPEDLKVRFPPSHLGTSIGHYEGSSVVTQGTPGRLIFGPYISLAPGQYRVTFDMQVSERAANLKIDVSTSHGTLIQAQQHHRRLSPGPHALSLTWACTDELHSIEFRCYVKNKAALEVSMITLEIIGNDPSAPVGKRREITWMRQRLGALTTKAGAAWKHRVMGSSYARAVPGPASPTDTI